MTPCQMHQKAITFMALSVKANPFMLMEGGEGFCLFFVEANSKPMSNFPFLWPTILFHLFLILAPSSSLDNLNGHTKHRREVIVAHHGVVATDDGRCSKIGMDVLRAGGHAVDASVAAALCLGVVSPASSGLGGGAFMLIRLASGKAQAFDMRETAPMKAYKVLDSQII
ncbi:hypothetical protein Pint_26765 [Pistacia integerrima]|uniref:Uncharacterized protein n=1 Tax=Pistacia integerrima TaxID=434235 RepID=A0ACC0YW01_9ROSI|nr:hypothetical protein Pint_26765 [Pistacia integerrima]